MKLARLFIVVFVLVFLAIAGTAGTLASFTGSLPQMIKIEDYKPLLVSKVFARENRNQTRID